MPGPDAPPPLLAALARRAAAAPAEPWLFQPRGGDWVWVSWEEGNHWAGEEASRLPPGLGELFRGPGQEVLLAAAEALEAALPRGRALGRSRREVVVAGAGLRDPGDRALFTWSLLTGAALVVEPEPAAVVPTTLWARPTLFHGDADRLAAFRRGAAGAPRAALRRLHSLVLAGPAPLPAEDLAHWRAHGVAVVPLPAS
ncbi:MAG TPA: hypothetical protein VF121_17825 [Thermoanaerobaculia bacterium]|nr:hypothetical protein [Thermoanaerobaculia bacterium]